MKKVPDSSTGKGGMSGMSAQMYMMIEKAMENGKKILFIDPKMEMTNPSVLNSFKKVRR